MLFLFVKSWVIIIIVRKLDDWIVVFVFLFFSIGILVFSELKIFVK